MCKLCFRATFFKMRSSIKLLQLLKKKMGWMEKRKETGDPGLVGALVEQVICGAIENSSYIVILLSVRSAVFCV